jgi:hypothetical protein
VARQRSRRQHISAQRHRLKRGGAKLLHWRSLYLRSKTSGEGGRRNGNLSSGRGEGRNSENWREKADCGIGDNSGAKSMRSRRGLTRRRGMRARNKTARSRRHPGLAWHLSGKKVDVMAWRTANQAWQKQLANQLAKAAASGES